MKCVLCMFSLHVCLYSTCLPGAPGGSKGPLVSLELELQVVTMLVLGLEPSPLEEQVLVTTDLSLQPLSLVFFNVRINHSGYVTSALAVLISTVEMHM